MAQVCELTGKRPAYGNKVSHSNIKTRTRWMPNLRSKKYMIPELQQTISILLSSRAIRTIDKHGGITQAIMAANAKLLSERLNQVRNKIYKARVKRTATGKVAGGNEAVVAKAAAKTAARTAVKTAKTEKTAKKAAAKASAPKAKKAAAPKKAAKEKK